MGYKVNEIFYSVQGEGIRAGTVNVFLRFADCNLKCSFCDTDFSSFTEMSAGEIHAACLKLDTGRHHNLILTGGEPSLQWDEDLRKHFKTEKYPWYIAIETNGMHYLKSPVDWVTCSPKTAEHTIRVGNSQRINELKYVRDVGQAIPQPGFEADYYLISPLFKDGWNLYPETVKHCIELVKENPPWRLSLQTHKFIQAR